MKILDPYRCDGPSCGKLREKDANHWWLVMRLEGLQQSVQAGEFIGITPWNAAGAEVKGVKHVCGIDCMLKLVGTMAHEINEGIRGGSPRKGGTEGCQASTPQSSDSIR